MNWLPSLGAWQFAAAGVAGAAGTVLIHFLNRRRHQLLHWGAMEFLQQAIKRNRRVIQLRDAILLALRSLAVLFFGLALSRPYYSQQDMHVGPRPIHAIVVIDNSLSMSYRTLQGSLSTLAKQAAVKLIERMPEGSQVSVLASCGDATAASQEPMTDFREACSVIESIEVADLSASIKEVLAGANAVAHRAADLPHRIVFFTDQQNVTWKGVAGAGDAGEVEQLQVVNISPRQRDNTWVAMIDVQDGFAEARTVSTIHVSVGRSGGNSVRQAEVSLLVDEQLVGSKSVTLQAGEGSQLVTFRHSFITNAASGSVHIPIKAVITPDRLTIDDTCHALIPVISRLPIVFVDQFGADREDVRLSRLGETRSLRRLLRSDREDDLREVVVGQRHVTIEDLDADAIEGARLVVLAGVRSPGESVAVLRKFVEDGGQLLIAAGGDFSARQWHELAWLDGNGILPAPLTGNTRGRSLRQSQSDPSIRLTPTFISFESLRNSQWLRLPGSSDEMLEDLYSEPLFFKWTEIDESPDFASAYHVVARLEDESESPLLVERDIDQGRVLFFASAITSDWNTLSKSNAVVMLDRLAREMLRSTLDDPNATTQSGLQIELPVVAQDATVMIERPDHGVAAPVESDFLDRERFGVTIRDAYRRGVYKVAAMSHDENGTVKTIDPIWEMELALNGDPAESDLTSVDDAKIAALAQHINVSLARSSDEISLTDSPTMAHGLWWWLTLVVLALLMAETLTLVSAHRHRRSIREAEWAT
ncbi:MAG: BatA domain-containing protein [Planctomycetes bacterium]|nr:BatA domain-containing protein [Planctomycetota bacterium]